MTLPASVMRFFGASHLLWLAVIAAATMLIVRLLRRRFISTRAARIGLAALLIGGELQRYFHDGLRWPNGIPLNLCNISTWMAVIACVSLAPWAVEFVYFSGLTGAALAVLTPDMGGEWPPRFFANHGAIIVTAAALVYGRIVRLRPGAAWRAYGMLLVYAAAAGAFDWGYGTNYGYLRSAPPSFWGFLGPWPVYLVSIGLMGAALFWILWRVSPDREAARPDRASWSVASPAARAES